MKKIICKCNGVKLTAVMTKTEEIVRYESTDPSLFLRVFQDMLNSLDNTDRISARYYLTSMRKVGIWNGKNVTVPVKCPECGKLYLVSMSDIQFEELKSRNIPNLSASDREAFITGICSKCWNEIFADDDEF